MKTSEICAIIFAVFSLYGIGGLLWLSLMFGPNATPQELPYSYMIVDYISFAFALTSGIFLFIGSFSYQGEKIG